MDVKQLTLRYSMPGAIAGAFNFAVDGDFPGGHQCAYNADGLLIPVTEIWPIVLYGLRTSFQVKSTGNQVNGLATHLWVHAGPGGDDINLSDGIYHPVGSIHSWIGAMPCLFGFGVSIYAAAGLGTTHELILSAIYEQVGRKQGR